MAHASIEFPATVHHPIIVTRAAGSVMRYMHTNQCRQWMYCRQHTRHTTHICRACSEYRERSRCKTNLQPCRISVNRSCMQAPYSCPSRYQTVFLSHCPKPRRWYPLQGTVTAASGRVVQKQPTHLLPFFRTCGPSQLQPLTNRCTHPTQGLSLSNADSHITRTGRLWCVCRSKSTSS